MTPIELFLAVSAAVAGPTATVIAAIIITRRGNKKDLASIELKVDGRLEAALEAIDRVEAKLSVATGIDAPPPVAGHNQPTE